MANVPTEKEVNRLQNQSLKTEEKKVASQAKLDKEFVNSGQGVIPETVWKELPGKTGVS